MLMYSVLGNRNHQALVFWSRCKTIKQHRARFYAPNLVENVLHSLRLGQQALALETRLHDWDLVSQNLWPWLTLKPSKKNNWLESARTYTTLMILYGKTWKFWGTLGWRWSTAAAGQAWRWSVPLVPLTTRHSMCGVVYLMINPTPFNQICNVCVSQNQSKHGSSLGCHVAWHNVLGINIWLYNWLINYYIWLS